MTMRVAALYDIHGNLPALEAVLQEVRQAAVDHIVVGGDVLPGPMPDETMRCLLDLDIPVQFIYGNCEVAVLEQMAGKEPARMPKPYHPTIRWTAERVHGYQQTLAGWPKTLRLDIPGSGAVLFCHATPRNEDEVFTRLTPDDRLAPILDGLDVSMVVCGHTHMQFDRLVRNTRVVNAGSVGMPFGEPGADWLLLAADVQLRHTSYDLGEAAARIRATGFPYPDDFATRYVLQPPSEKDMLDAFTRASI
jgi:predicted phosphodiesterase